MDSTGSRRKLTTVLLQKPGDIFMGMVNEIPSSSQGSTGGDAQFSALRGKKLSLFEARELHVFLIHVQKKLGSLKSYTDNPKGKWAKLEGQVTKVYLVQEHPVLKLCNNFQKGEFEARWQKLHFKAGSASQKMTMDLLSSASDIWMLHGIL